MGEGIAADAGGGVGHQGDAEDLQPGVAGGDGVQRGGHAHQVTADGAGVVHFGRGLVLRAGELDVDALRQLGVHLAGDLADARGVEVGQVHEGGSGEGSGTGEVDVVGHQDRGARGPVRVQAAAAVGQHHDLGAGRRRCADRVGHSLSVTVLVEVGPGAEDQRLGAILEPDRAHRGVVARDGGGGEAGQLRGGHGGGGLTDQLGGAAPPRAQDHGDPVAVHTGGLCERGGCLAGLLETGVVALQGGGGGGAEGLVRLSHGRHPTGGCVRPGRTDRSEWTGEREPDSPASCPDDHRRRPRRLRGCPGGGQGRSGGDRDRVQGHGRLRRADRCGPLQDPDRHRRLHAPRGQGPDPGRGPERCDPLGEHARGGQAAARAGLPAVRRHPAWTGAPRGDRGDRDRAHAQPHHRGGHPGRGRALRAGVHRRAAGRGC